jgi:REP element-mobilizing transposase RayT
MASTYLSLHYHVVFGTKERLPMIDVAWQPRLHEYLGGTLRQLGGVPEAVGGVADHVHVLAGLRATHSLSEVVREMKKSSSAWVHQTVGGTRFAWQDGYAAFTVSATSREAVRAYIANQEEHHRRRSFREEVIEMLEKTGVVYDPKYLD